MDRGQTRGSRRFVVGVVLFGASFGIGLAMTYALISSSSNEIVVDGAPEETAQEESNTPRVPSVAMAPAQNADGLFGSTTGSKTISSTESAHDNIATTATDSVITTDEGSSDSPVKDGASSVGGDGLESEKTNAVMVATAPGGETLVPVNAGWQDWQGRKCRVGLEEVGFQSLSLRKGKIKHGAKVSWQRSFSKSRRVGKIRANKNAVVEVVGIGVDESGRPSAAYVKQLGTGKKGVISLQVEGKSIRLFPLEDNSGESGEVN